MHHNSKMNIENEQTPFLVDSKFPNIFPMGISVCAFHLDLKIGQPWWFTSIDAISPWYCSQTVVITNDLQ